MNTMQFVMEVLNWLQTDPSHIVVAAAVLRSMTPTPDPSTPQGKAYQIIELFALSFMHAKDTGVPAKTLEDQVNAILEKQKTPTTTPPQA